MLADHYLQVRLSQYSAVVRYLYQSFLGLQRGSRFESVVQSLDRRGLFGAVWSAKRKLLDSCRSHETTYMSGRGANAPTLSGPFMREVAKLLAAGAFLMAHHPVCSAGCCQSKASLMHRRRTLRHGPSIESASMVWRWRQGGVIPCPAKTVIQDTIQEQVYSVSPSPQQQWCSSLVLRWRSKAGDSCQAARAIVVSPSTSRYIPLDTTIPDVHPGRSSCRSSLCTQANESANSIGSSLDVSYFRWRRHHGRRCASCH